MDTLLPWKLLIIDVSLGIHFSCESKYCAFANYTCETLWLRRLLVKIKCIVIWPTVIGVVN